ncbi:hypothetical protein HDV06_000242 [Boothiomyces sp. JEL0866]|nr:hypothetical protein HDV06_000242 [Boothiomyces sp. JEL0866]
MQTTMEVDFHDNPWLSAVSEFQKLKEEKEMKERERLEREKAQKASQEQEKMEIERIEKENQEVERQYRLQLENEKRLELEKQLQLQRLEKKLDSVSNLSMEGGHLKSHEFPFFTFLLISTTSFIIYHFVVFFYKDIYLKINLKSNGNNSLTRTHRQDTQLYDALFGKQMRGYCSNDPSYAECL